MEHKSKNAVKMKIQEPKEPMPSPGCRIFKIEKK